MASMISTVIKRAREVRWQPYWDRQVIAAAGTFNTDVSFFQVVRTNAILGNMQSAGQFPYPKQFWITGVSCFLQNCAGAAQASIGMLELTVQNLMAVTTFSFEMGDKKYLQVPLFMLGAAGGSYAGALPTSAIAAQLGWPTCGNYYRVKPSLKIPSQQNFIAKLLVGNVTVTVAAADSATIVLHGYEERAVQ